MTISQVACSWTGLQGGVGYSIFYVRGTLLSPVAFTTFFGSVKTYLPNAVTVNVPNTGKVIDEATGKMTGVWAGGSASAQTGNGGANYPATAGCQIKWLTSGYVNGRRVQGRTYLVPLPTSAFTTTGTIATTTTGALFTAASTLITDLANNFVVWARPLYGKDSAGNTTDELIRAGTSWTVSSTLTPTKQASLRGRRDT